MYLRVSECVRPLKNSVSKTVQNANGINHSAHRFEFDYHGADSVVGRSVGRLVGRDVTKRLIYVCPRFINS